MSSLGWEELVLILICHTVSCSDEENFLMITHDFLHSLCLKEMGKVPDASEMGRLRAGFEFVFALKLGKSSSWAKAPHPALKTKREMTKCINWTASNEFGTYRLCEQRRFRRACASAQSRQNLRCSLIQAVNQEEPSDRKPDPWPLWMAGHAQLKFVMTECSKTQIRLTGPNWRHFTKDVR